MQRVNTMLIQIVLVNDVTGLEYCVVIDDVNSPTGGYSPSYCDSVGIDYVKNRAYRLNNSSNKHHTWTYKSHNIVRPLKN